MQLPARLEFDICYVIKTRVGFKISEITRFLNYFSCYSFVWALFWKKITTFLCTKYFFDAASSWFCWYEILFWVTSIFFLLTWNTFSCNINTFLSKPNYFFCNAKLFVSTQIYFSCNTKFLIWTSFIMLCHGDIFLLSHNNKNIITCQKIHCHFYASQKNYFVFSASPFCYIQFLHYTLSACWTS